MNYTIDTIIKTDIKICQPENGFRFGIDSVLLAWFATIKKHDNIIDIGSGSGVLSILINHFKKPTSITAVEFQKNMFGCLQKTVHINNMSDNIAIFNEDIRKFKPKGQFSAAICNPPYRTSGTGKVSINETKQNACFDNTLNADEMLKFCKSYVKFGGRLAFCGDTDRLNLYIIKCRQYNFEPKRLAFIHSDINTKSKLFLMECGHGGKGELTVEPPVIQKNNNTYHKVLHGEWL